MANDINHVVLVGRLTRDSELRYTNSGLAIAKFSIAVNRRKRSGEQWEDEASFFDITYFGKAAEAVNQYLTKGKQIAIDGELRQNRWEQDGQARSKVEVVANNVQLLGGTGGAGGNGGTSSGSTGNPAYSGGNQSSGNQNGGGYNGGAQGGGYNSYNQGGSPPATDFEDDIPF
ncbi:MAG: single-stranded DNA-binding protein [Spirochaetales bacterium]|nr:single-stranded DNA-binding protein [Spirochaetales bacterium]